MSLDSLRLKVSALLSFSVSQSLNKLMIQEILFGKSENVIIMLFLGRIKMRVRIINGIKQIIFSWIKTIFIVRSSKHI